MSAPTEAGPMPWRLQIAAQVFCAWTDDSTHESVDESLMAAAFRRADALIAAHHETAKEGGE